MPTSAAIKIGVIAPLLAVVLMVIVTTVSVLWRASQGEDDPIKSRPLYVIFPVAALIGGGLLAGANALVALLVDGGVVATAAYAGAAAGAVSAPLLLAGLLVGLSATLCFTLPFLADVGALFLAARLM